MILFYMLYVAGLSASAQQIVLKGKVKNKHTGESIPAATVLVKGRTTGATANDKGDFTLTVGTLPASLLVSSVNFEEQEVTVSGPDELTILLTPAVNLAEVIVEGGTRTRTKLINSPVTVERIGLAQIRTSPTLDYYDLATYLKGADVVTSSLTFKTISTRGFNGSGSTRVNQIVDGMDNQAPGLNFFVGNFAGLTELDVESMELLSGASSALYGPGGMNGTVLIHSKSPFKYEGLSMLVKEGVMHVDERQRSTSPYHNFSLRWAKAFNDRVAFKVGAQYISAQDWLAGDTTNYIGAGPAGKTGAGSRYSDPNYNGVNVYGDETTFDVRRIQNGGQWVDIWAAVGKVMGDMNPNARPAINAVLAQTPASLAISRTGYHERDIIDPQTKNIKLSGALHYKLAPKLEAIAMGYWATGNTVYTGNNRYALKGIKIGQYKVELKHPSWFVRGYTTQEDAGEAYTATVTAQYFNEAWKPTGKWYQEYAQAYLTAGAQLWGQIAATQGVEAANAAIRDNMQQLHMAGRTFADKERPVAGSAEFTQLFDRVRKTPISKGGGLFLEKSQLWMGEGQYNFSEVVKFAEIVVGGNYKRYILNSEGTLFIDKPGDPIGINEVGAYAQVTRKLLNNALTLSFSGRVDKNEDFKEKFTPRATALVRLAENNNLRFSYQSAYRFPSTQQKYINLNVGSYTLLGGLPWIVDAMDAQKNPLLDITSGTPVPYQYTALKPENMTSFEAGFKGLLADKRLLIDAYGYWGRYEDFLGRNILLQPATGRVFSTVVNSSNQVKTHGFGLGMDYQLPRNFSLFFNGYSDAITDVPTGFQPFFNTPKYRFNTGVANAGLGRKGLWGFNALFRWQDAFQWDGELANGPVEAFGTLDAQVSYKLVKIKTVVKLGGTNILNKYYKTGYANPEIGGVYYASIGTNIF